MVRDPTVHQFPRENVDGDSISAVPGSESLVAALRRIDVLLRIVDPSLMERLRPPAETTDLRNAARRLGRPLPPALGALWSWHDGQVGKGTLPVAGARVSTGFLLPLAKALDLLEGSPLGDRWPPNWLPLVDGGNGDGLAADLETPGTAVVEWRHEEATWPVLYPDIESWVTAIETQLAHRAPPTSHPSASWGPSGDALPEDHAAAVDELRARAANGRLERSRLEAAHLLGDARASGALDLPPLDGPRTGEDLRWRVRRLAELSHLELLAAIALAASPPPPETPAHPVMGELRAAAQEWVNDRGSDTETRLRTALDARSRAFVPLPRVDLGAQQAARLLSARQGTRADLVLTALAPRLDGRIDGAPENQIRETLRFLHHELIPWVLGTPS